MWCCVPPAALPDAVDLLEKCTLSGGHALCGDPSVYMQGYSGVEGLLRRGLVSPWAFGNGNNKLIQHEVTQGQVRNLKILRASGADQWDSNSPNVSLHQGQGTELSCVSTHSSPAPALAHPTMVGTLPKGTMPSGRARSWGLRSQSRLGRPWVGPQGCENSPGSNCQT